MTGKGRTTDHGERCPACFSSPSPRAKTRGPCRTAEGSRRYSASFRQPFRRLVPMNMDSPDRVRGRLCFRRNDGKRPDRGSGQAQVKAGMTEPGAMSRSYSVTPGLTRGPCRTAEGSRRYSASFRQPFRRLVPMNMDSPDRVRGRLCFPFAGMTEKGWSADRGKLKSRPG
jgi:hypothetical protein